MLEALLKPSREKLEETGLYQFARKAKRKYFEGELRQEKRGNANPFEIYEIIPPTKINMIEESLDRTLNMGGAVAVIDLTRESPIRVHVITKTHYAKFLLPPDPYQHRVEGNQTDDFSILLTGSVIPGSPSLFLDIVGEKLSDDVSWQEHEDPNRRFAIITNNNSHWEVILDARIYPEEGEPSWKVNTSIYT